MTNTTPQEALEWTDDALQDIDESRVKMGVHRGTNETLDRAENCIHTIRQALTDHEQLKAENEELKEYVKELEKDRTAVFTEMCNRGEENAALREALEKIDELGTVDCLPLVKIAQKALNAATIEESKG